MSNVLTQNVMNISVSTIYSISVLGFYSFATRIIAVPTNLIGTSIGQVFYQQAIREKQETGKSIKTFRAVLTKLTILSLIIFFILFFFIEDIFAIIFGESWRIAGQYAKALIPFVMMKFIISPLSTINNIYEKQIVSLIWQIGFLVITVTALFTAKLFKIEFFALITIYSWIISGYYLILLPILINHSKDKNWLGYIRNKVN